MRIARVAGLAFAFTLAAFVATATRAGGLDVLPRPAADGVLHSGVRDSVTPGECRDGDSRRPESPRFDHVSSGEFGIDMTFARRALSDSGSRSTDMRPRLATDDLTYDCLANASSAEYARLTLAGRHGFAHGDDIGLGKAGPSVRLTGERYAAALGDHVAGVVGIGTKPEVRGIATRPVVARVTNVQAASIRTVDDNECQPMSQPRPSVGIGAAVAVGLPNVAAPFPAIAVWAKARRLVDLEPELQAQTVNGGRVNRDIIRSHREPPTLGAAGRDVSASPAIAMDLYAPDYSVAPLSIPVRAISGATVCRAAPMSNGLYLSAHCTAAGPLYIDGIMPLFSVDPVRDLMHMGCCANPAVVLRPAVVGEVLYWRNDRAAGELIADAIGWQVDDGNNHYDYSRDEYADGERVILTYWRSGSRFAPGDSGTGAWGSDGQLVGILVSACTDIGCVGPQAAAFVPVP